MDFQSIAAIIFIVLLTIYVYAKRSKLETKSLIPYVLYFSMYRARWGLKLMDSWAKKFPKTTRALGYIGIVVGFIGMAFICFTLVQNLYHIFTKPAATAGVGIVLPVKAKGVFYVPFFYWIISIFVIAVVHEFAHGLIARAHNMKVKSSGFAFLGLIVPIIPAAFVEPDEKQLRKRPHKEQLSVFAAGPFSNVITAFAVFAIAAFLLTPVIDGFVKADGIKITDYTKGDEKFPTELSGISIGEIIKEVDGKPVLYVDNLSTTFKAKKPGDSVIITTDKQSYELKLAANPENKSAAYMGAYLEQSTRIDDGVKAKYGTFLPNSLLWFYGLLIILFILNLGIGLFNLVPIGPLDGGRMMQLAAIKIFGVKTGNKVWAYVGFFFLGLILINVVAGFVL
ncbi:MAG TPA: site-2 protease family protein [Candidatus Nanoarchaeia archaeon]|nr:site-2 protease family protein [Candidatus Nanoarchaeia archaeon]